MKDTGIGIVESDISKLFEECSQLDNSTTRKYDGAGLGLNVVAEMLKLLNGTIEINSQKGVSSTFTVSILSDLNMLLEQK